MKIIKVTKTEFELEDGRVYEHPIELEIVPSIKEFQKIYNDWEEIIKEQLCEIKNEE